MAAARAARALSSFCGRSLPVVSVVHGSRVQDNTLLPWADTVMPDISYCSFLWDQLDHHAHLPALVCGELTFLPKSICQL